MVDGKNEPVKINTIKDQDFKTAYIDGLFGELNPERGFLTFYYDMADVEAAPDGLMKVKEMQRHLIIDIRMAPEKWIVIARWMMQQAEVYEKWKNQQTVNK